MARTYTDPAIAGQSFDATEALRDLSTLSEIIQREIAEAIEMETASAHADAQARVNFGTGRYRSAIRWKIFREDDGATTGKVFVIQLPWIRNLKWQRVNNPNGTKLWPKNLPLWLEYGTVYMRKDHDHLIPAFEAGRRRLDRAMERILQAVRS